MGRHKSRRGEFPQNERKDFEGCYNYAGHEACARMENELRDLCRTSPVRVYDGTGSTVDVDSDLAVTVAQDGAVTWDHASCVDTKAAEALDNAIRRTHDRLNVLQRAHNAVVRVIERRNAGTEAAH